WAKFWQRPVLEGLPPKVSSIRSRRPHHRDCQSPTSSSTITGRRPPCSPTPNFSGGSDMDCPNPKRRAAQGLPEDVILEILERLPARSIHRIKCVSRRWCDLIADPVNRKSHGAADSTFITLHGATAAPPIFDTSFSFLTKQPENKNKNISTCMGNAFVNGVLHFVVFGRLIGLGCQGKTCRVIRWPADKHGRLNPLFIGQSQGRLYCICGYKGEGFYQSGISVWVLETQEWVLKHNVSFLEMFGKEEEDRVQFAYNVVAIHPDCDWVFLVQNCSRELIAYGMDNKKPNNEYRKHLLIDYVTSIFHSEMRDKEAPQRKATERMVLGRQRSGRPRGRCASTAPDGNSFSAIPGSQPSIFNGLLYACNGLLLFGHGTHRAIDCRLGYIVCNPAIEQWLAVAGCPSPISPRYCTPAYIVFDPSVSPHFRLFYLRKNGGSMEVHTYSSESGVWTSCTVRHEAMTRGAGNVWVQRFKTFMGNAFVNGMLHFVVFNRIIGLGWDGKACRIINWPPADDTACFLGQSEGCLYCISGYPGENEDVGQDGISVYWVLQNDDNDAQECWVLKHKASFLELFGRKECRVDFDYNVVAVHPDCSWSCRFFLVSAHEFRCGEYSRTYVQLESDLQACMEELATSWETGN
ncbi:hypothetical protein U9M48_005214, partial [Paspalum notatum var. saurae]